MIADLFAGPGGWEEGLRLLGRTDDTLGVEIDPAACETAERAGHARLCADVAALAPAALAPAVAGLIASPPCTVFSRGGLQRGLADPRGHLVHEPLRWARALLPPWLVCEQVPTVLPIWQAAAHDLRGLGYTAWAGILDAVDYGVPQTRGRATPPVPGPPRTMEGALGWEPGWVGFPRRADECARITLGGVTYRARDLRATHLPSLTVTGKARSWSRWTVDGERHRVDLGEAAILQGFPEDYPWAATSRTAAFQQVANAVPPPLAAALLARVLA